MKTEHTLSVDTRCFRHWQVAPAEAAATAVARPAGAAGALEQPRKDDAALTFTAAQNLLLTNHPLF